MLNVYNEIITLDNGVLMQRLGLGVYKMTNPEETLQAITYAIDMATVYENEEETGEAVRHADVPREELFITSKVWNTDQGYDETLHAFEKSLTELNLEYLDLYFTHGRVKVKFVDTYRAIERRYEEKLIRATGCL